MASMGQLSNERVADTLGLSSSAVSRMRRGERIASPRVMLRISEAYGVTVEALTRAAAAASEGDREQWIALMSSAFRAPGAGHAA